jgi:hypothetical protein
MYKQVSSNTRLKTAASDSPPARNLWDDKIKKIKSPYFALIKVMRCTG